MKAILALAVVAALVAPLAAANHPDGQIHFTVKVKDLEPGATHTITTKSEEGAFREGWMMIFVGGVVGNATPLDFDLRLDNASVATWQWTSGKGNINLHSLALPATSEHYTIEVSNPGTEPLKFFFYYDQSCNCLAKPFPFPGSFAVFNFDFFARETAWFRIDTPDELALEYTVATRNGAGGEWPGDFTPIKKFPDDALPNGTVSWAVPEDGTYYILARATSGEGLATPQIRVSVAEEPVAKDTPFAGAVTALAVMGVAAWALRRR